MIGIYKITNPKGKTYIGQSVNIEKRWNRYKNLIPKDCIGQPLIYRSLIKYGVKNHIFEIIELCNKEELNKLESYYIVLYNSFNSKCGLNLTSGGTNYLFSDISRRKMSIAQKNKIVSKETRLKLSAAQIGKTRSASSRKKMSDAHKNISKETRLKMSISQKNRPMMNHETKLKLSYSNRKIILNVENGIFYYGRKEAADSLNISLSNLSKKLVGINFNNTQLKYV